MLSEGHLLLEDVPGTGKTSLARAMAQSVQGTTNRIQFTPDLLPGDITGISVYDQRTQEFEFHRGPVFANIVLADEINRASPKTQSALLEAMEESAITVDGVNHRLAAPFMVIATQNPIEQAGTYRLPEAQLDRFLMKTSIGYPDHAATVKILETSSAPSASVPLASVVPAADHHRDGRRWRAPCTSTPSIADYVARLVDATRSAQRGPPRRQRPRGDGPDPRSPCPRGAERSPLRHPRRRQGARRAGARAPPGARRRGRVRRRQRRRASSRSSWSRPRRPPTESRRDATAGPSPRARAVRPRRGRVAARTAYERTGTVDRPDQRPDADRR